MMYSRQAHQHTVQLNSAIFKAGYFYGKTVLRDRIKIKDFNQGGWPQIMPSSAKPGQGQPEAFRFSQLKKTFGISRHLY